MGPYHEVDKGHGAGHHDRARVDDEQLPGEADPQAAEADDDGNGRELEKRLDDGAGPVLEHSDHLTDAVGRTQTGQDWISRNRPQLMGGVRTGWHM